jgi:hypothetical protein
MCTIRKLSGISLTKSGKTCISLKIRCQGARGAICFVRNQVSGKFSLEFAGNRPESGVRELQIQFAGVRIRGAACEKKFSGIRAPQAKIFFRYQVSGHQELNKWCQVSGVRYQVSGARCQVSGATAHIVVVLDDLPI